MPEKTGISSPGKFSFARIFRSTPRGAKAEREERLRLGKARTGIFAYNHFRILLHHDKPSIIMRRKIFLGFLSLVFLLIFAGAISVYELNRLQKSTERITDLTKRNTEAAQKMFSALRMQDSAVMDMLLSGYYVPGEELEKGRQDFSAALDGIADIADDKEALDFIRWHDTEYRAVIDNFTEGRMDTEAFVDKYRGVYYDLDSAVMEYITSPKTSIAARTSQLERSVYKTITPSILTLIIAIAIVLVFYFFLSTYYIRPVLKINKGLKNYLTARVPYEVHFDSNNDELRSLNSMVEELIERKNKQ